MSGACSEIHEACAHTFREVVVACAQLTERLQAVDRRLEGIARAVVGNGDPHDSLLARVERLESAERIQARSSDRFWKVLAVAASVAAVIVAIVK
jgi:hypothetical protein